MNFCESRFGLCFSLTENKANDEMKIFIGN